MHEVFYITYFLAFTTVLFSGIASYTTYKMFSLKDKLKQKQPKQTDSQVLQAFLRDAMSGGAMLEVSYINPEDVYFHRRG